MAKKTLTKTEYHIFETVKLGMSQMFDENAKVVPFTSLKLTATDEDREVLKQIAPNTQIKVAGYTKGRGFTGGMKRWNFHGGPATHGQKDRARSLGSIGTQGYGHVSKGQKMPGHYGNEKVSHLSYYLSFDEALGEIKVKGGVPGARNSKILIYLEKNNAN